MYRIGCCLPGGSFMPQGEKDVAPAPLDLMIQGYRAVLDAGYDYAEATVGLIMKLSEEELARAAELRAKGELQIETCNSFIPASIPLVGEEQGDFVPHVKETFRRMNILGADTVVFGSGGARRIPDGFSEARAQEQLDHFLRVTAELAAEYGVTVVIEPLNQKETNVINSVDAGAAFVRRIQHPNLKLLADAYHMHCENEPLTALVKNDDVLTHIHVAEPPARIYPNAEGGSYLRTFGAVLRGTAYSGRVTIECKFTDFVSEIKAAQPFMKEVF